MKTIAGHADSDSRSLLHEAALAAISDDTRYLFPLLRLKFPLYGEDVNQDFAAFIICETTNENTFLTCLNALLQQDFDINRGNDDDESFLQRLCLCARASESRIKALLRHQPPITPDQLSQLTAKAAISKQRANQTTKKAIQLVK